MNLFKITVIDEENMFRVQVWLKNADTSNEDNCIWNCGWKGDEFEYKDKRYSIIGPYHSFVENGNGYRVYELVSVSEVSGQ